VKTPSSSPAPANEPGWKEKLVAAAASPHGLWVLLAVSFFNSSFFPISPYYLFVPMCFAQPRRGLFYAWWSALFCVLGGIGSWWLGHALWSQVSDFFYHYVPGFTPERMNAFQAGFNGAAFSSVAALAVSPLPFKVLSVACGVFSVPLPVFLLASFLGRFGRMVVMALLIQHGGDWWTRRRGKTAIPACQNKGNP
jgi:membrane protein YqaA with SNARE-associated domain